MRGKSLTTCRGQFVVPINTRDALVLFCSLHFWHFLENSFIYFVNDSVNIIIQVLQYIITILNYVKFVRSKLIRVDFIRGEEHKLKHVFTYWLSQTPVSLSCRSGDETSENNFSRKSTMRGKRAKGK